MKFKWLNTVNTRSTIDNYEKFVNGLKVIYFNKVLPLENASNFNLFHSPPMEEADFEAKPVVVLLGQYSTGKTTFIKYLLKNEFPGMRIGPEPTTDKFIALTYGKTTKTIPGNALAVDASKQYRPLSRFGNNFLNKFQCSEVESDVLKDLTIIDTPGILSGEKQRVDRGYDFVGVLKWFAERADRMLLLFDAHKLDISDEFRRSIEALQGHDEKIKIVLNKSDMIDQQQLMRVYGALMWSLGKIISTPEVTRVYIGSFWDQPLRFAECKRLFELEQEELLCDLMELPRNATIRKLNDFIKRIRLAKAHAYVMQSLYSSMPFLFGKKEAKKHLIYSLDTIYEEIQKVHHVSPGDLPDVHQMRYKLTSYDFARLTKIKQTLLDSIDEVLSNDIQQLMQLMAKSAICSGETVTGGMFESLRDLQNPFGAVRNQGINDGFGEKTWIVDKNREKYLTLFEALNPCDGRISSNIARSEMMKSQLPNPVLGEIWKLCDIDKDGAFDFHEFALAMYLIELKLTGCEVPSQLPQHLIPPNKRAPDEASLSN